MGIEDETVVRSDRRSIDWYMRVWWDCVHFETIPAVQQIMQALGDTEYRPYEIDGSSIGSTRQVVSTIAQAMGFPTYVKNLDGLLEFLRTVAFDFGDDDTQVIGRAPGVLLFVRDAGDWLRRDPLGVGELVSVWLSAAEGMSAEGVSAHLVLEFRHEVICG